MATAEIADVEFEAMFQARADVLALIDGYTDGIRAGDVAGMFPRGTRDRVMDAIDYLKWRGLVVEVTRTHGRARSEMDHKRLMVLRSGGVR